MGLPTVKDKLVQALSLILRSIWEMRVCDSQLRL